MIFFFFFSFLISLFILHSLFIHLYSMCNFIFQDYTSFYSFYYFLINLFYFFLNADIIYISPMTRYNLCGHYYYHATMKHIQTYRNAQKNVCTHTCTHSYSKWDKLIIYTHTHTHTNILSHAQNELLMKSTQLHRRVHMNHTYIHIKDSCATPLLKHVIKLLGILEMIVVNSYCKEK